MKAIAGRRRDSQPRRRRSAISPPASARRRLHDVIVPPRPGLPGGALIVDRIEGRRPDLPRDLGAMADTLARHSFPADAAGGSPIPRQKNPFLETLELIEQNARRFLDKAVHRPRRARRDRRGAAPDARHGAGHRQAAAAAHHRAGRHPSRQLHRRSRRHRPGSSIWRRSMSARPPSISRTRRLPTSTLWHPEVGKSPDAGARWRASTPTISRGSARRGRRRSNHG